MDLVKLPFSSCSSLAKHLPKKISYVLSHLLLSTKRGLNAPSHSVVNIPLSICDLWNLQTLNVYTISSHMVLPSNISDLVNLRHVYCDEDLYLPSIGKPMKVQYISNVVLGDGVDNFHKCFPGIKQLTSTLYADKETDFEVLRYLQDLRLIRSGYSRRRSVEQKFLRGQPNLGKNHIITFPNQLNAF